MRAGTRRAALFGAGDEYIRRVLNTRPIALWPLSEPSGTVAQELVHGWNGTHTGVTLGQPGIGDGRTCPLYDGVNDYTNVWSAGLATNPANELLANGGFETAGAGGADVFAGWIEVAGDGALAAETTLVHSGSKALKLTTGATKNTAVANNTIPAVPGAVYQLEFYTAGDGVNAGRYNVKDASQGYANILSMRSTEVAANEYQHVSVQFTAPAGCTVLSLNLYCPDVSGGVAYFDDVSVKATSGSGFNGSEGSLMAWGQVANAGVWTDGEIRRLVNLGADSTDNYVYLSRMATNNLLRLTYKAEGVAKFLDVSTSALSIMNLVLTWSKSTDQVTGYMNGVEIGAPLTGLGTWAGALSSARTVVGASTTTAIGAWSGTLGPVALWDRALTPGEVAALARVN